jgi:nucleoside-diphosphate kinase
MERTFVILKPDTLQRGLIGEIIRRIERTGLKLVALKMVRAGEEQLLKHYNKDEAWMLAKGTNRVKKMTEAGLPIEKEAIEYGRDIMRGNVAFMTASPLCLMVWEGNQAVGVVLKLVGVTEPLGSDVGTIRGDFTLDSYSLSDTQQRVIRNLIHCSDKPEEATREINLWFKPEELHEYRHILEEILYDVNLDGIRE